jgi:hypothetical protein
MLDPRSDEGRPVLGLARDDKRGRDDLPGVAYVYVAGSKRQTADGERSCSGTDA